MNAKIVWLKIIRLYPRFTIYILIIGDNVIIFKYQDFVSKHQL